MVYNVVVTKEAEEDLDQFLNYLVTEKRNIDAAKNVLDDFDNTIEALKMIAGSLKLCDNPRLHSLKYRRMNFLKHRYFMLYRVVEDIVYVDNIFHELQDFENKMY